VALPLSVGRGYHGTALSQIAEASAPLLLGRRHRRSSRGRGREEGAVAGRRPSGSGTRNPHRNVLIVGIHGCSFVCEWT
jgi:hypothetical protein